MSENRFGRRQENDCGQMIFEHFYPNRWRVSRWLESIQQFSAHPQAGKTIGPLSSAGSGDGSLGPSKNNFTFYPSRHQVIFARSEDARLSKKLAIPLVLHLQIEQIQPKSGRLKCEIVFARAFNDSGEGPRLLPVAGDSLFGSELTIRTIPRL